ncbi:hypothetical protein J113_25905 [Mycobacterium tuberculosis CAS/NITR204]|uniref:Uncharacterized protein n=9 Tax=Mycobacterium tuberculosis TaxID=1773 RepID=R4MMJ4_MYCTX|nr:hypothetical protein J113_25905 [Mycobacterium tuberculosis CAS/NITR204]
MWWRLPLVPVTTTVRGDPWRRIERSRVMATRPPIIAPAPDWVTRDAQRARADVVQACPGGYHPGSLRAIASSALVAGCGGSPALDSGRSQARRLSPGAAGRPRWIQGDRKLGACRRVRRVARVRVLRADTMRSDQVMSLGRVILVL